MVSVGSLIEKSRRLWRVGDEEVSYIEDAISNGLTGEYVKIFEDKFAKFSGCEYAIAVNSGTSALHAALLALGVGPGDEVIVPPLTFVATAYAVLYVGATPVFADVDSRMFTIDPSDIENKISSSTKAIISVALYGLIPEMDRVCDIAKKYNLALIEDNAQCVLGHYKGRREGSFGDISIYSLQRSKHLTVGDGGVVITNNERHAEMVRKYADLGYCFLTANPLSNENFKETIQRPDFKRHELVGYNFRMPEICAAMGIAQIDKAHSLVNTRKQIGRLYADVLRAFQWLLPQYVPLHIEHTYWAYAFVLHRECVAWEEFKSRYQKYGGDSFYGAWSLSYLEPSMQFHLGCAQSCPIAEDLQPRMIQLKTNYESLSKAELQCEALLRCCESIDSMVTS